MAQPLMTIQKAVFERRSVRTFDGAPLTAGELDTLNSVVRSAPKRHFGPGMVAIRHISFEPGKSVPGTYGIIKGCRDFLVLYSPGHICPLTMVDTGLIAGYLTVALWRRGFGSCIMTGTFSDSSFGRAAHLSLADSLLCVIAVGHSKEKRLLERIVSGINGSDSRLPLSKIAFRDSAFKQPWMPAEGNAADARLKEALEGLRRAPSAYNRQPWRVVVLDNHVEIHNSATDPASWIGIGTASCNYCAINGWRSNCLEIVHGDTSPVIIASLPDDESMD